MCPQQGAMLCYSMSIASAANTITISSSTHITNATTALPITTDASTNASTQIVIVAIMLLNDNK